MRRLATALLAIGLAAPGAAEAAFEPIPGPPGTEVIAFAASGDNWVAVMDSFGGGVQYSRDSGATWSALSLGIQVFNGPSVAPDGAFWFTGSTGAASSRTQTLARIGPDGAVTQLAPQVPLGNLSAPAFDPDGRMWVAVSSEADKEMYAIRLNPDGSEAQREEAPLDDGGFVYMSFTGTVGWIGSEDETYRLRAGRLDKLSGPATEDHEWIGFRLWPVSAVGSTIFGWWSMSVDGGDHFTRTTRPQLGVHGRPDLLVRWPVNNQPRAPLLRRCASFVFCETGLDAPAGTIAVWETKRGLLAVSGSGNDPTGPLFRQMPVFALHSGAIPAAPNSRGPAPRGSARLVAQMNRFRKEAGMPPLIHDPAMSRAALAHAKYVQRHGGDPRLPSTYHVEGRGKKFFTGENPGDRCAAQGTNCDTEEVLGGANPIRTMMGSYYHRLYPMNAFARFAGAATYRGRTVVDLDAARASLTTRPHGFPNGRYSGPRNYFNEIPDPLVFCHASFTSGFVGGTPVVFVPPGMEPNRPMNNVIVIREGPDVGVVDVRLFKGKRPVPGCGDRLAAFIPTKPLRPRTRYQAKARWKPTPKSPVQTYTWSFKTR